jgi:threonine dehydrogenase-like Zn-dependent dehydrogenase
MTDGGVSKTFEALGNTKTADQIIRATRPGGTAIIIGGLGKVPFTISDGSFTMDEIKIAGVASRRSQDVVEVISMVRDKRIEVSALISKQPPSISAPPKIDTGQSCRWEFIQADNFIFHDLFCHLPPEN